MPLNAAASGNVHIATVVADDLTAPLKHTHTHAWRNTGQHAGRFPESDESLRACSSSSHDLLQTVNWTPGTDLSRGNVTKHVHSSAALEFKSELICTRHISTLLLSDASLGYCTASFAWLNEGFGQSERNHCTTSCLIFDWQVYVGLLTWYIRANTLAHTLCAQIDYFLE